MIAPNCNSDFREMCRTAAVKALEKRKFLKFGEVHFFARVRWDERDYLIKIRGEFERAWPDNVIEPRAIYREHLIMSELSRVDSAITPVVLHSLLQPASFVMENLEIAGFKPLAQASSTRIRLSAWDIGHAVARLHLALSKLDKTQFTVLPTLANPHCNPTAPICRDTQQLIHGDLNTKNILLYRGHVRFIDFEKCRIGSVAEDIGWCLGHLLMRTTKAFQALQIVNHFSEGYDLDLFKKNTENIISSVWKSIEYRSDAPSGSLMKPARLWTAGEIERLFCR